MAALEVWYDQVPENNLGPGDPAIIVRTHAELSELLDKISGASAHQGCPSIINVTAAGISGHLLVSARASTPNHYAGRPQRAVDRRQPVTRMLVNHGSTGIHVTGLEMSTSTGPGVTA